VIQRYTARPATIDTHLLAEGPLWDPVRRALLWIDVDRGRVMDGTLDEATATIRVDSIVAVDETVGAVVVDGNGRRLVAGTKHLFEVDEDGTARRGVILIPSGKNSRLNDGACDSAGRFVVGSLSRDNSTGGEILVRIDGGGAVTTLDSDLALSNGLAWTADGTRMFSIDTIPGVIWVRDYTASTGQVGPRELFLTIDDGSPDGMCLDSAGNLWIAIWGAGEVRCFSGKDGTLLATVSVAAPHTSSVAFAGENLDILVITTAQADLGDQQLADYPDSGRLFTARVGVAGAATTPWDSARFPVVVHTHAS